MKLKLYSVFDIKTEVYNPPIYCHNEGHARRVFTTEFNRKESVFSQYPEDFRLFEVGEFADATGMLTAYATPKIICEGIELVNNEPAQA